MHGGLLTMHGCPETIAGAPSGERGAAAAPEAVVVERGQRLSRSALWRFQRAYFERAGVDAWRKGEVPHFITSNPFVAAAYARIVVGFLRDVAAERAGGAAGPAYVVELGAGSGRFAHHLLKRLFSAPRAPVLDSVPVRYVMTDVSRSTIAFWRGHPKLRPFFDAGVLDVARFDVERDEALHLEISGETLAPGALRRPLVAVANYLFDSLPQDAYLLREGRLYESRATLTADDGPVDLSDPSLLRRLTVTYEHVPVELEGEPDLDPEIRLLLREYRAALRDGAVQIPTAALACVRALSRLAGGRFLLLSADKGHCHEEDLLYQEAPEMVPHGGCVSLMVNYHAIGRYVEHLGGRALFPVHRPRSLCVGAFLLGAPSEGAETCAAFSEATSDFGPDEWFSLKKGVEVACGEMDLGHLLAALRLGGADGKVIMDCFDRLLDLAPSASAADRLSCLSLARRAWDLHYPIGEERDLAFHLGVWMRELGHLGEAIAFFDRSVEIRGPTPETAYNLAYCHFTTQRYAEALRWIEAALAGSPDLPGAGALRIEIRAALRLAGAPPGASPATS